MNELMNSLIN